LEKARERARQMAEALLEEAKKSSLRSAAQAKGLEVDETSPFTREGAFIPRIGDSEEIKQAAFGLTKDAALAGRVFQVGDSFVVIELVERTEPTEEEFAQQKEQLAQQVTGQRRAHVLEEFANYLQSKAKIDLHPVQLAAAGGRGRR